MRRPGVALAGLVLLLTPFAVISLLCWWWLVATEMPGRTWVRRGLFAVVAVFAVTAGALTGLAVLRQPCDPRVLLGLLLAVAVPVSFRLPHRTPTRVASTADRWAVGFGALTFAVLYAPFVGASTGRTMALMSQTTDGGTHVQLVTAVLRYSGYVHLIHPPGLSPDVDHYPSAWHGSVWVLSDLLLGRDPSVGALVRLVAVCAVAGYALLCATAAAVALEVGGRGLRLRRPAILMGLTSLALSTLLGFGIFLVQLASYTHIMALVALLCLVLLAEEASSEPVRSTLLVGAAGVALMQSWYLAAPLIGAVALVLIFQARPPRRLWLPVLLVSAPLGAYPVLTGPTSTQVDMPGSTLLPTLLGVLGLLGTTALGCLFVLRGRPTPAGLALVSAAVAALLSTCFLIAKQGFVAGSGVSYYGAKLLLTVLFLGCILGAALVGAAAHAVDTPRRVHAVLAAGGVALGTWSTAWVALPPQVGNYDKHLFPRTLDALVAPRPEREPGPRQAWVLDGCDRVGDRVATKWLYDTSLTWTDTISRDLLDYALANKGDVSMITHRLADPAVRSVEVYVHQVCDHRALAQLATHPKVRVIRVP